MKITFNRAALLQAITDAASATPSRTPKDILRSVLLTGKGKLLEVIGTDQEIGIRAQIPEEAVISNTDSGLVEVLLHPSRIKQILSEIGDVEVVFEIEDSSVRVISKNAKFKLTTEDAREFPPVPTLRTEDCWRVAAPIMAQAIRRTEFACDSETTRYALGGINVEIENGDLILAATDSRRLSVARMVCEKIGGPDAIGKTTVVPSKAWKAVTSACSHGAEFVDFVASEKDVTFRVGRVTIYTRLVDGRFPRWRDVIPKKSPVKVVLPCGPFFAAVRQAQICLDTETRAVSMRFADGSVKIDSTSQAGESAVEFPCEYDSEPLTMSLDPKYIADLLRTLSAEQLVECSLKSADDPILLQVGESLQHVIMPLASDR